MVVFLHCIDFSAELYINAGFPSSLPFNTAHYIWDTCSHEKKLLLGRLKLNKKMPMPTGFHFYRLQDTMREEKTDSSRNEFITVADRYRQCQLIV